MSTHSATGTLILPDFLIDIPGAPPKEGWGVRVLGETIDDSGPQPELLRAYPEDDHWHAPGQVLSPGFVDAHTHLTALIGHGATDLSWPTILLRLDSEMVERTVESALFHNLAAGVTAIGEALQAPTLLPGILPTVARLIESWGMRASLSYLACERESYEQGQAGLAENAEMLELCGQGEFPHISAYVAADGSKESSGELREDAESLAWDGEARCLLHTERSEQTIFWIGGQGRVYTPLLDWRFLAEPVSWLILRGDDEVVGLGSDGSLFDFFRVMRSARRQSRYESGTELLPASHIWRLATSGGAELLGMQKVGKLLPGWQADLQTIDLTFPAPVTAANLYAQLLRYGSSQRVQSVIVAGKVLVMSGVVLGVDAANVRARGIAAARKLTGSLVD
ncbi:MAG: amidohydrolase family protein [Caldilineaceae bacterium]|nr:amidohydrolase family protein [Caldilineaceae bacterium]